MSVFFIILVINVKMTVVFNCLVKLWQWASKHNTRTLKLKQLDGTKLSSLRPLFIHMLFLLWHVKMFWVDLKSKSRSCLDCVTNQGQYIHQSTVCHTVFKCSWDGPISQFGMCASTLVCSWMLRSHVETTWMLQGCVVFLSRAFKTTCWLQFAVLYHKVVLLLHQYISLKLLKYCFTWLI